MILYYWGFLLRLLKYQNQYARESIDLYSNKQTKKGPRVKTGLSS